MGDGVVFPKVNSTALLPVAVRGVVMSGGPKEDAAESRIGLFKQAIDSDRPFQT